MMRFLVVLCLFVQVLSEEELRARLVPLANIPIVEFKNADLGIELTPFSSDVETPHARQVPLNWIPVADKPSMELIPLGMPVEDDHLVDAPPKAELIPLSDIPIGEGEDVPRAELVPLTFIPAADTAPKAELVPLSFIPVADTEPKAQLVPLSFIPVADTAPKAELVPLSFIPVADTEPKAQLVPLSFIPVADTEEPRAQLVPLSFIPVADTA